MNQSIRSPTIRPDDYQPPKSVEELIARFRAGERYFEEMDFDDGACLRGVVLAGANLSHSWFFDADFSSADLRDVLLEMCNIKCAMFSNANLKGASVRGCA